MHARVASGTIELVVVRALRCMVAMLVASMCMACGTHGTHNTQTNPTGLIRPMETDMDSIAITNTVAAFFGAVDAGDWSRVESLMTRPIHIDYSSFGGGEPADAQPADVVRGWQGLLPGFDHTHHQLGNLQVVLDGEGATVEAYVTATHVIDTEVWTVVGRYVIELVPTSGDRWLLSSLRFTFTYQTGAITLPSEASRRAKEQ